MLNFKILKHTTMIKTANVYPVREAIEASTAYFGGDELAASVWVNKYALKDSRGNIYERTPEAMHRRIAAELSRIEQRYPNPIAEDILFKLLEHFRYIIPQGSPMSGIGNDFQVSSLSNCFVIGNHADSYGGIIRADEEQVQLMKRRGGVGHDLSHIRPKGSPVMNSALSSTGITPFMDRYSNATREVAQDGRRGALMLTISIQHPDAEDFIDAKLEAGKVTGANVSVRIDDAFMHAVKHGEMYSQQFPVDSAQPLVVKETDARKLWDKIIYNAWKSAEPGVLFWDTIIRESVADCYADLGYRTISTNPCGEIPLCPYDSCRLLAINLYSYVEQPFTSSATFDFEKFRAHARMALRMMDDIIDLEIEKISRILEKIDQDPEDADIKHTERVLWEKVLQACVNGRRTGVGITAEGDMLAALGLKYGSEEAIAFAVKVQRELALQVYGSSVELARERGAFPIYDANRELENPFIQRIREASPELYEDMVRYGRRNIALLTIAPTGTTSLMSQTSSGIEPVFMVSYLRRRKVNPNDKDVRVDFIDEVGDHWEEYHVFHHKFREWLCASGYDVAKVTTMSREELQPIIELSPYAGATANDVDWLQKVRMQGAIQQWVDHSISVTVNIPEATTVDMVRSIYETAWASGCKGCTIYRDGSRSGVLIAEKQDDAEKSSYSAHRPKRLEADIVRFKNNHERWMAFIGLVAGKPYEIFTGKAEDIFHLPAYVNHGWILKEVDKEGRKRYDFQFTDKAGYGVTIEGLSRSFDEEYWNYAKLISGILRQGMRIEKVVDLVNGLNVEEDHINTWKNGVVRALKRYVPDGTRIDKALCPQCQADALVYKEGCVMCTDCGYSECG
jgi:ribonucleoside-diphosphate reductase alpha chain